jgi:hypothetical protein
MSPLMTAARRILLEHVSEKDFRQQVATWAEERSWLAYWTWNSKHSPAGFPDLVVCRPPRLIIAELKTQHAQPPKGRQAEWLDWLGQCQLVGCSLEVYLWRPLDEDAILEALR